MSGSGGGDISQDNRGISASTERSTIGGPTRRAESDPPGPGDVLVESSLQATTSAHTINAIAFLLKLKLNKKYPFFL